MCVLVCRWFIYNDSFHRPSLMPPCVGVFAATASAQENGSNLIIIIIGIITCVLTSTRIMIVVDATARNFVSVCRFGPLLWQRSGRPTAHTHSHTHTQEHPSAAIGGRGGRRRLRRIVAEDNYYCYFWLSNGYCDQFSQLHPLAGRAACLRKYGRAAHIGSGRPVMQRDANECDFNWLPDAQSSFECVLILPCGRAPSVLD